MDDIDLNHREEAFKMYPIGYVKNSKDGNYLEILK